MFEQIKLPWFSISVTDDQPRATGRVCDARSPHFLEAAPSALRGIDPATGVVQLYAKSYALDLIFVDSCWFTLIWIYSHLFLTCVFAESTKSIKIYVEVI